MSESRVRENRMHGLTGGRCDAADGEDAGATLAAQEGESEPGRLPTADKAAAYPTDSVLRNGRAHSRGFSGVCLEVGVRGLPVCPAFPLRSPVGPCVGGVGSAQAAAGGAWG